MCKFISNLYIQIRGITSVHSDICITRSASEFGGTRNIMWNRIYNNLCNDF